MRVPVLIVAALLLAPRDAHAKCGPFPLRVAPPSGEVAPDPGSHGWIVVRVFDQEERPTCSERMKDGTITCGRAFRITSPGNHARMLAERSTVLSLTTYALSVAPEGEPSFAIQTPRAYDGEWETLAHYHVGQPAPVALTPGIRRVTTAASRWVCSHELTTNLEVATGALGYVLTWSESRGGPVVGRLIQPPIAVPPRQPIPLDHGSDLIRLGYQNCGGSNFDWSRGRVWVRVYALEWTTHRQTPRFEFTTEPIPLDPPKPNGDAGPRDSLDDAVAPGE